MWLFVWSPVALRTRRTTYAQLYRSQTRPLPTAFGRQRGGGWYYGEGDRRGRSVYKASGGCRGGGHRSRHEWVGRRVVRLASNGGVGGQVPLFHTCQTHRFFVSRWTWMQFVPWPSVPCHFPPPPPPPSSGPPLLVRRPRPATKVGRVGAFPSFSRWPASVACGAHVGDSHLLYLPVPCSTLSSAVAATAAAAAAAGDL